MVSSVNPALLNDVETKAARTVSFGTQDPDANYRFTMQMKLQLDSAHKNGQRTQKELAILYKRFILTVDRTVGPILRQYQFQKPSYAQKLMSVNSAVMDSTTKFNELMRVVSTQGNVSNIPGLSQPGAAATGVIGYGGGASTVASSTSSSAYGTGIAVPATGPSVASSSNNGGQQYFAYGSVPISGSRESQPSSGSYLSYTQPAGQSSTSNGFLSYGQIQVPTGGSIGGQQKPAGFPTSQAAQPSFPGYGQSNAVSGYGSSQVSPYGSLQAPNLPSAPTVTQPVQQASFSPVAGIRTVICPIEVIAEFLAVANPNTSTKIETCAILAGEEKDGQLIITSLIVPTQTGKQDQCSMDDEVELFECQIAEGLMTIGWIHTHPQFDLFLSSVDLHNQFGYQMQLPEAVAIVYSPIVGSPGYQAFRVKNSQQDLIAKCTQSGFHQHKDSDGSPSWEVCRHINYVSGRPIRVLDLRKNRF